jgi:hypothetical protein
MPRVRHQSEAVDIDHGHLVGRGFKDVAIISGLDELGPVGGAGLAQVKAATAPAVRLSA